MGAGLPSLQTSGLSANTRISIRLLSGNMISTKVLRVSRTIPTLARRPKLFSPLPTLKTNVRYFSNEDLKETLNKVKNSYKEKAEEGEGKEGSQKIGEENVDDEKNAEGEKNTEQQKPSFKMPEINRDQIINYVRDSYDFIVDNIRQGYAEMMGEGKESYLNRRVHQAESFRRKAVKDEEEDEDLTDAEREAKEAKEREEAGPSAIVVVKDPKSAWESMKERLQDSPFIREILKNSRKVGKQAAATDLGKQATDMGKSVQDKIEDARNFWETSQNPLVYTMSGVWDSLTGETEEGIAIAEIKKLDPHFNKEEWADEVKRNLAPEIIKAHLVGNTSALKPWLGEAVYNKLAADIRTRKHDGITFDSNILDIDENQVIMRYMENGSPVIVVVYMVQQINCIRKKGEIVEGSETDIRAKFYSMAFQQHYDEDDGSVTWRVVDYEFAGDMPYY